MKKELSPFQMGALIAVAVALIGGLGYWFTFGGSKSYKSAPPSANRMDMIRRFKTSGPKSGDATPEAQGASAARRAPR